MTEAPVQTVDEQGFVIRAIVRDTSTPALAPTPAPLSPPGNTELHPPSDIKLFPSAMPSVPSPTALGKPESSKVLSPIASPSPPALLTGYDSDTSSSESSPEKPESSVSEEIRPRKPLMKRERRHVRFAENVEIRYIPSNRENKLEEARHMQEEFNDFIDSLPIARQDSIRVFDDPLDDHQAQLEQDLLRFQEEVSDVLVDVEEEDFALVDAEDKRDELAQKNLEDRVAHLRNKLKRPRDEDSVVENLPVFPEFEISSETEILDDEMLKTFTLRKNKNKRRRLTPKGQADSPEGVSTTTSAPVVTANRCVDIAPLLNVPTTPKDNQTIAS